MSALAEFQENLFKDAASLPSTACRRRFVEAMLTQRDMKSGHSDLAKRMEEVDKIRLVRDRFAALKACVVQGKDIDQPYLYKLTAPHH